MRQKIAEIVMYDLVDCECELPPQIIVVGYQYTLPSRYLNLKCDFPPLAIVISF